MKPAPLHPGTSASTRTLPTKTSEKETSFPAAVTRPAGDLRSGPDPDLSEAVAATDLSEQSLESELPVKTEKLRPKFRKEITLIRTKLLLPKLKNQNAKKYFWCFKYHNLTLWFKILKYISLKKIFFVEY